MKKRTKKTATLVAAALSPLVIGAGAEVKAALTAPDHFNCYNVEGDSVATTATLTDQFTELTEYKVLRPQYLCNPVDKNGEGISNFQDHLVCYDIRSKEQILEEHTVTNQFGSSQILKVRHAEMLCVPSCKDNDCEG
jgi:hypothetical protein